MFTYSTCQGYFIYTTYFYSTSTVDIAMEKGKRALFCIILHFCMCCGNSSPMTVGLKKSQQLPNSNVTVLCCLQVNLNFSVNIVPFLFSKQFVPLKCSANQCKQTTNLDLDSVRNVVTIVHRTKQKWPLYLNWKSFWSGLLLCLLIWICSSYCNKSI